MRKILILITISVTFSFFTIGSFAQESKNNQESFSQTEDSLTVSNLLDFGKQYIENEPSIALRYFANAEKISSKIGYLNGLSKSFYYQGIVYKKLENPDSSFYFFNSSLFINRRINNNSGITLCLVELALYSQNTGDYAEAIRNYFRSLDILINSSDIYTQGIVYHNIGSLYLELNKNTDALNYSIMALDIEKQFNDSTAIGKSYYNLGLIYFNLDSLEKSELFFNKSLKLNSKISNKLIITETYLGIARLFDKKQQFETALTHYQSAIKTFISLKEKQKLAQAYYYYGNHLLLTNKKDKALENVIYAVEIIKDSPNLKLKKEIYTKLQEIYTSKNEYEKAHEYAKLLNEIEEKLKIPEALQYLAINEAELNFKLKEEKTKLIHEKALNKQKNIKLIFIGSSVFALVLIILILIVLTEKSRHNKLLKKANDTRDKMFRLIAHDFRSPLISISNTVHLIPFKIKKKDYNGVTDLCENVTNSVNRVLTLIDNLINWALSQHDNIPYNPEEYNLHDLSNEIVEIYLPIAAYKNIDLINSIPKDYTIFADKNILNTVFRNLINNAIKFTPDSGNIEINAEQSEQHIHVSITDNGIGIPNDKIPKLFDIDKEKSEGTKGEKGNGLGLFFCKEFVKKNKGEIWAESEVGKGSVFYFTVPAVK